MYSYCFTLIILPKSDSCKDFTSDNVVKLKGVESWVHISQLKKTPPGTWLCVNAGDLKIKLTRERSNQHGGRLLPPKMSIQ